MAPPHFGTKYITVITAEYQITPMLTDIKQLVLALTELQQDAAEMACLCSMISWTWEGRHKGSGIESSNGSQILTVDESRAISWDTNRWLFHGSWPSSQYISWVPRRETWERKRTGRGHFTFYRLALEITQCHFRHILLVELQKSTHFKGERMQTSLTDRKASASYCTNSIWDGIYIVIATMENIICNSKLGQVFDQE